MVARIALKVLAIPKEKEFDVVRGDYHLTLEMKFEFSLSPHLEKRSCQLFYYCVHMALPNDTAIQTRCLRSYVSFYVRCSVPGPGGATPWLLDPTIARPAGRVHCRLFVVAFSDVHARRTSFFGTASCISCFGYFVSCPGLFRFGAAETSFRGILLNDR